VIERIIDIWRIYDFQKPSDYAVCITTNGFVRSDGRAVMGRGTAAQASVRFPRLAKELGRTMLDDGNKVRLLRPGLIAFPVKPVSDISDGQNVVKSQRNRYIRGSTVPGWAMKASLPLIEQSLKELAELQMWERWTQVYLPRPGCGAGELDWESQVRPLCAGYGDWLVAVTNE
jgi:hypothetical protein